jgi:hypothetical protein
MTERDDTARPAYEPPAITYLGDVAELTRQKEPGAVDGVTFQGIDLGSV